MVRLYHDPKELKVLPEQNFSQNTLRTWQANGENQKKEVDSVSGLQKEVEELKKIIKEANIKIPEVRNKAEIIIVNLVAFLTCYYILS